MYSQRKNSIEHDVLVSGLLGEEITNYNGYGPGNLTPWGNAFAVDWQRWLKADHEIKDQKLAMIRRKKYEKDISKNERNISGKEPDRWSTSVFQLAPACATKQMVADLSLYQGSTHPLAHLPRRSYRVRKPGTPLKLIEGKVDLGGIARIERTSGPRGKAWLNSPYVGTLY